MTIFLERKKSAEILALSPLATSGTSAGAPSATQFVLGALDVIRFAQGHCAERGGWIAWLREAAALRSRARRLAPGRTVDASPLTLPERARLAPVATAAMMRDAMASADSHLDAAALLGVGIGEWTAALRCLPELAAELRGGQL